MIEYNHQRFSQRVHVVTGDAGQVLAAELSARDEPRILLIASDRAGKAFESLLSPVARMDRVEEHVPFDLAKATRALATQSHAELIVCIGGGSAIGLAKAVALELDMPIVAIPTTFAGSEATAMWGITERGHKATGIDAKVLPSVIIYDIELLLQLPHKLAITSALNALAHGVDALWAPGANPLAAIDAEAGIRAIASALNDLDGPLTHERVQQLIVGTYLSAAAFAVSGSGMHHAICHVLGAAYELPHAPLHAVILPHVLAFNISADAASAQIISRALGTDDPVSFLRALFDRLGAPRSLNELDFRRDNLDDAARRCLDSIPSSNPRSVDLASLRRLLSNAWEGQVGEDSDSPR